jgi:hypothetical protein
MMQGIKRTSTVSTSSSNVQPWERAQSKEGWKLETPVKKVQAAGDIRNMIANLNSEKD